MSDDIDQAMALIIQAEAAREADPVERFIRSLKDPRMTSFARETMRMREELVSNFQRMLMSQEPREALVFASWIAENAPEVAYRWSSLLAAATKFAMNDLSYLTVVGRRGL